MTTFESITSFTAVMTFVGSVWFIIFKFIFQDKDSLEKLKDLLRYNKPLETYHSIIKKLLQKTVLFFGGPFSWKSFNRILFFAFIYSFVVFLLNYVFVGNPFIDDIEIIIFPDQINVILRVLYLIVLIIFFLFLFLISKHSEQFEDMIIKKINSESHFFNNLFSTILLWGLYTIVTGGALLIIGTVTGGKDIDSIISDVGRYDFDVRTIIDAFVYIFGIWGNFLQAISGHGSIGVLIMICLVCGIHHYDIFGFIFLATLAVLAISVIGINLSDDRFFLNYPSNNMVGTLFIIILPIANSIADISSFEISRFLTNKSVTFGNKAVISAVLLADFLIAVALLLGTAFLISFFIELYNLYVIPFSKGVPINWRDMAILARDYPLTKGLNVTLMLFSTLIWTAIHAVIAFGSLVLSPIGSKQILGYLSKEKITNIERMIGALWLTANIIISFVCLFVIPYCLIKFLWDVSIAQILYDRVMSCPFLS
jgi:hypothetical protein